MNYNDENVRIAKIYRMVDCRHSEFESPTSTPGIVISSLVAVLAVVVIFMVIGKVYNL